MRQVNSNNGWMDKPRVNKNTQVDHNLLGINKADNEEYEDAINEFTNVLSQNPNDAHSYFVRATLKVRIGDIEGARKDFKMCEVFHVFPNSKAKDYPLV